MAFAEITFYTCYQFSLIVPAFDDVTDGCIAGDRHRCWCGVNWRFTVTVVCMPLVCHIRTGRINFATWQHAVICPIVVTCA